MHVWTIFLHKLHFRGIIFYSLKINFWSFQSSVNGNDTLREIDFQLFSNWGNMIVLRFPFLPIFLFSFFSFSVNTDINYQYDNIPFNLKGCGNLGLWVYRKWVGSFLEVNRNPSAILTTIKHSTAREALMNSSINPS